LHDRVQESPWVVTVPLIVLAVFAAGCAIGGEGGVLFRLLIHSEPVHVAAGVAATAAGPLTLPGHSDVALVHGQAGTWALLVAFTGAFLAAALYWRKIVDPADIKRQFAGVHGFLVEKWQFDEMYDAMFVRPVHIVAAFCKAIDRVVIDGFLHSLSRLTVLVSGWDRRFDEVVVDGLVNLVADVTFAIGRSLRVVQTGRLRQYVMFLALGVVVLFAALFATFPK